MALRLYIELLNAYNKKGYAMKKKTDLHNQCQVSFFHAGAGTSKENTRGSNFPLGGSAGSAGSPGSRRGAGADGGPGSFQEPKISKEAGGA